MKILFQFKQVPGPNGKPLMVLFTKDPNWRPATSDEANTFLQGKVLTSTEVNNIDFKVGDTVIVFGDRGIITKMYENGTAMINGFSLVHLSDCTKG